MADIKKQLTLIATLDDSAFKAQMQKLKKDLGSDFSLGKQDLGEFKTAFQNIAKDFAAKIKEAMGDVSKIKAGTGVATQQYGSYARTGNQGVSRDQVERDKEVAFKIKSEEKLEAKRIAEQNRRILKEEMDRKKAEARIAASKLKEEKKIQDQLEKERDSAFKKRDAEMAARAQTPGGRFEQLSGLSKAGIGLAGIGIAGMGLQKIAGEYTGIRQLSAQRNQALTQDVLAGRGLEGAVGESGRGLNLTSGLSAAGGALKYGAGGAAVGAGIGSLLGPLGTLVGGGIGAIGGAAYGGIKGFMSGGEDEAETRKKEAGLALDAVQNAKALRQPSMGLLRGGLGEYAIKPMIAQGAQSGFSAEETLQQANQAQSAIGSRNLFQRIGNKTTMQTMQDMMQETGVGVGQQAQAAEIFAGAGKSSIGSAVSQNLEIIKKGVAAGLDISKSAQFLKTTADYAQSAAGLGGIDTDRLSTSLAEAARGFAGGNEVTGFNVEQARQLNEQLRSESTSKSDIAGIGNIMAVQDALGSGASTEQFMAAQNISADATSKDVQDILGVDEETANKFLKSKKQVMQKGFAALGLDSTTQQVAFGGAETGQTSEQFYGRLKAERELGTGVSTTDTKLAGTQQTDTFRSLQADAVVQTKSLNEGFELLKQETSYVNNNMKVFNEQLSKAVSKLQEFSGMIKRQQ